MLSLSIQHHIFLTKEQRYAIHEGIDLVIVGVSIPVWFTNKSTSEPAKEIFCKYYLKNHKKDLPINIVEDGYEIYLPCRAAKITPISHADWRTMNKYAPSKLDDYYKSGVTEVSTKCLLEPKDGGGRSLFYREHNTAKLENKPVEIVHFVVIEDMKQLIDGLELL